MAQVSTRLAIFCRCSTIRGVPKIVTSDSRFLRSMWFLFVIIMFLLLNVSAIRIIFNFLEYDVTIQTKLMSAAVHKFPALTLCNHNPFSKRAPALWENGSLPSPTEYNRQMRGLMKKFILAGDVKKAKILQGYDSISLYYQSLSKKKAENLGHTVDEMISHCMMIHGELVTLGDHRECGLTVRLLSNYKYFNCYTLEPDESVSPTVSALYLIVDLGRHPNPSVYQQAFFSDVFEQAYGLRVQIHESGNFPNLEKEAMHIEPGKMVEISYTTTEWQMFDSPKQHCHPKDHLISIIDDGEHYHYTRESCIDQYVADYIRVTCGCVIARMPRRQHPGAWNPPIPYCGHIDPKNLTAFFERLKCLSHADVMSVRNHAFNVLCLPRCIEHKYPSHFSVTQWRASSWQLHWLLDQNYAWRTYENASTANPVDYAQRNASLQRILNYLDRTNLSFTDKENKYITDPMAYAYIVLRRSNFDLTSKTEKLSLSLEALLSRLGGLCSLCLGLTCAFVFELVEFCYLICWRRKDPRQPFAGQVLEGRNSNKREGLI